MSNTVWPFRRIAVRRILELQLKVIQECVTLVLFVIFAILYLKEKLAWNYVAAFVCIGLAAFFAFAFNTG